MITRLTHIDALRAIAVTGVVVAHFGSGTLPGGVYGVDVFFVISGFVITRKVYQELQKGQFELAVFYAARARRILPALVALLLIVQLAWYLFALPSESASVSNATIAAVLFSSNWYYFFTPENSYFSADAELNPLLHLWSLAIEEQYYLVFPIFLVLASQRFARSTVSRLLYAAAGVALLFSLVSAIRIDVFYVTPARSWELLLGAGIALSAAYSRRTRMTAKFLPLGLALVLLGFVLEVRSGSSYQFASLIPVLGAALVTASPAPNSGFMAVVINNGALQWVGRASYSIYLWHWPVLVFVRRLGIDPSRHLAVVGLATVVLGFLSWRFVEGVALRSALQKLHVRRQLSTASAALASVLMLAATTLASPLPVSVEQRNLAAAEDKFAYYNSYQRGTCFLDLDQSLVDYDKNRCLPWTVQPATEPRVLLIGDSHAAHLYEALHEQLGEKIQFGQYSAASCRPVRLDVWQPRRCTTWLDQLVTKSIPEWKPEVIIVAANWQKSLELVDRQALTAALGRIASGLRSSRLVVVGQMPTFTAPVPRIVYVRQRMNLTHTAEDIASQEIDEYLKASSLCKQSLCFFPRDELCQDMLCDIGTFASPLFWDEGHLTLSGARRFAPAIAEMVREQPKS